MWKPSRWRTLLTFSMQILGTGVNSSGSIAPASAPVASAQRDAMQRAFNQTDRCPEEVDFLELHATGMFSVYALASHKRIGSIHGSTRNCAW